MKFTFIYNISPVEQFMILPLVPLFDTIYLSINNVFILITLVFLFIFFIISALLNNFNIQKDSNSLFMKPNRWQSLIELIIKAGLSITNDNINSKTAQNYIPLIFTIFFFLLISNILGLIPCSYTITSHLIVTFAISLFLFIGINIICYRKHKLHIFSLFLPQGTSTGLAFLLVPIEFISYIFKPISLSIRLFANMMAGHTLLKVIAGFGWTLMMLGGFTFLTLHLIPILILIPLFILESAVAVIQSFVFTVLICIYLNDAINLH
jgi:ATP synthase subunit 6